MQYLSVTAIDSPHLPFIKKLYHSAFPQEERREWKELLSMIGTAGEMNIQVIADQGKTIGLISSGSWMTGVLLSIWQLTLISAVCNTGRR